MDENYYKLKYIKYKNKYLNLQNEIKKHLVILEGGNDGDIYKKLPIDKFIIEIHKKIDINNKYLLKKINEKFYINIIKLCTRYRIIGPLYFNKKLNYKKPIYLNSEIYNTIDKLYNQLLNKKEENIKVTHEDKTNILGLLKQVEKNEKK